MDKKQIKICTASEKNLNTISNLGIQTFFETYADFHSKKDMFVYLKKAFDKKAVLKDIQDENTIFLIAFVKNKAVGYAKLTSNKTPHELRTIKAIELERIYILKRIMGKGVGKILMKKSLTIAKNKNFNLVWLSVWENNPKAIAFYKKFGFEIFGGCKFRLGKTRRNNFLMKKLLSNKSG